MAIPASLVLHALLWGFFKAPSFSRDQKSSLTMKESLPMQVKLTSPDELYSFDGARSKHSVSSSEVGDPLAAKNLKNIFNLTPSQEGGTGNGLSLVKSPTAAGRVYRFSGEGQGSDGGRFTYSVYGSGASHSFWTLLSRDLDSRLNFIQPLYRLGGDGKVSVSLDFLENGALDESSVSSAGEQRYLKVFTLREICQAWCVANDQKSQLIKQSKEPVKLHVTVNYVSGSTGEFSENPTPVVVPNKIMIERRWKTAFKIGEMNIFGDSDEDERSSLNLGFSLEPESFISSDHRKRYGWSGRKQIQARFRALKLELERLAEEYQRRGWI